MFRWLWFFALATLANSIVMMVQFWQMANAQHMRLFGFQFTTMNRFWWAYAFLVAVTYPPVNYLYFYLYWYGYNEVFPGKAWYVQETMWFSALVVMFFSGWLYLGELPAKNAVLALFFLGCAFVAIVWK